MYSIFTFIFIFIFIFMYLRIFFHFQSQFDVFWRNFPKCHFLRKKSANLIQSHVLLLEPFFLLLILLPGDRPSVKLSR